MKELRGTVIVAALALLALVALRALVRGDPHERNFELFPEMAHSLAAESYARSAVLPGGTTQQPLVAGVVVHGRAPFPYPATPEGAAAAGRELKNPFAATDATARARGAERFAIFCAHCHGSDGQGRGPVVERGMLPPPSLLAEHAKAMQDGQLYHVVTCGQGNMAAHAALLPPDDRWKTVLHMRVLQGAQP
jgi:mono/diheme cytochrome c family protein